MKKILAFLLAAAMLFGAALAETNIQSLSNEELQELYYIVAAEMELRGLTAGAPDEYSLFIQDGATAEDETAGQRLLEFFRWWARNDLDNMLTLCDPAWQAGEENPRTALFALLQNRTPMSAEFMKISGEGADRTINVYAIIDRHNGKENLAYLLQLRMRKAEDGCWYLDPASLGTYEQAYIPEEPTPEPAGEAAPEAADTADTRLYYVAAGGEYYHVDPNCRRVNEKFLPMQDSFGYGDLDDPRFRDLKPCAICGAPAR